MMCSVQTKESTERIRQRTCTSKYDMEAVDRGVIIKPWARAHELDRCGMRIVFVDWPGIGFQCSYGEILMDRLLAVLLHWHDMTI